MSEHDHSTHQHGSMVHEPAPDAEAAYQRAYDAAQPDAGRVVVPIELEATEINWSFVPGSSVRAWGYNGRVPGPPIEARVGDVLEIRFTNHLPQPTNIHWRWSLRASGISNIEVAVVSSQWSVGKRTALLGESLSRGTTEHRQASLLALKTHIIDTFAQVKLTQNECTIEH